VFQAVRGEEYKPAIRFVIAAAQKAGLDEDALQLWWDGMSDQTIKGRLHGWRLWAQYCEERGVTAQGMTELVNPAVQMANFATYVNKSQASDKWKSDSRPAAAVLVDLLLPGAKLAENAFFRRFSRSAVISVRRQSRYGDIWALGPVLDGIRNAPPVESLGWKAQQEEACSS
jgi:hypothetical protein